MVNGHENLVCMPSVFAVDSEYQIFSGFDCAALVKVRVGGAITLDGKKARVVFNDDKGEILGDKEIDI